MWSFSPPREYVTLGQSCSSNHLQRMGRLEPVNVVEMLWDDSQIPDIGRGTISILHPI